MKITCPICERKILSDSYFIYCNCCHMNVYRNCTELKCDWLIVAETGTFWYCRVCNENIFPFNNIDDDYEFNLAIMEYGNKSFYTNHQSYFSEEKLFDPYEINENENIIEYQGELDPDKHYFNELAHHLSRSSNYYSDENLNKLIRQKNMNSESFSVLHLNIRSLPANLTSFMTYMSYVDLCFSVIGFSETWLTPFSSDTYGINGFRHVGLTRATGRGGGVSLFIGEKFSYAELHELNAVDLHIECVFAKLHLNGQTYIVGVVYRPPNSNILEFNNTMHIILEKITQYPCYIMGDFNLDLLKYDKHPPLKNSLILCMPILLYRLSIDPLEWPRILALLLIIFIPINTA